MDDAEGILGTPILQQGIHDAPHGHRGRHHLPLLHLVPQLPEPHDIAGLAIGLEERDPYVCGVSATRPPWDANFRICAATASRRSTRMPASTPVENSTSSI